MENRETSSKRSLKRDILETEVFGGSLCLPCTFCVFSVNSKISASGKAMLSKKRFLSFVHCMCTTCRFSEMYSNKLKCPLNTE